LKKSGNEAELSCRTEGGKWGPGKKSFRLNRQKKQIRDTRRGPTWGHCNTGKELNFERKRGTNLEEKGWKQRLAGLYQGGGKTETMGRKKKKVSARGKQTGTWTCRPMVGNLKKQWCTRPGKRGGGGVTIRGGG